jgi:regulatory protein YycH of two-component signal transduction system YycFG
MGQRPKQMRREDDGENGYEAKTNDTVKRMFLQQEHMHVKETKRCKISADYA